MLIANVKKWLKAIYHQLVEINDTPHRRALGLGIGIFLGIFPGMGPMAAIVASIILRVNRAAALLGSVLTNTWLSLVTFALASQIGSWIVGMDQIEARNNWDYFIQNFKWNHLLNQQTIKVIYPVFIGFFVVSFCFGLAVYLITYFVLIQKDKIKSA